MGCCNPRWVFSINTSGHHGSSKTRTTMKNTNASKFHRFYCYTVEATSSRSSTCICDRESRSLKLSSSAILHWERANKVFGSDLHDCSLASSSSSPRLTYLFVGHAKGRRLQHEFRQVYHRVYPIVGVKEP
jgi:hypothetical protein